MKDIGGHPEYLSCLPFLIRDEGLYLLLLNPCDFKDEYSLEQALWSWTEKLLELSVTPHLLIVVSKMDIIDEDDWQDEMEHMKQMLVTFLDKKLRGQRNL